MVVKPQVSLATALNARIAGCGPTTMVLAHGYGAGQSIWDNVLPELSSLYRVVLFDWSFSGSVIDPPVVHGKGKASSSYEDFADEFLALADEMGLRDVVYVGHSMAAMIGCLASIKRPELFRHLVLVGASPRYLNSEDYEGGFSLEEIEGLLTKIEEDFHQFAHAFASMAVGPQDPVSATKFQNMLLKMNPAMALSLARIVFLSDYRFVLEKVEAPCSIIQCSLDFVVPLAVVEYMERKIKAKTTVDVIDGGGHFLQLTVPDVFMNIIKRVVGVDLDLEN